MSTHISDDELLTIFRLGFAGGAATATAHHGAPEAQALQYGAKLAVVMHNDPAARHEVLTHTRRILAGKPGSRHTVLRGDPR